MQANTIKLNQHIHNELQHVFLRALYKMNLTRLIILADTERKCGHKNWTNSSTHFNRTGVKWIKS